MAKKLISVLGASPKFTLGTWNLNSTSNILEYVKVAADQTAVVIFDIPRDSLGTGWGRPSIVSVALQYTVGTAALDAAPSVVLNKLTMAADTKVITRAASADTTTVAGTDTTGTAAGTFTVKGAFDTPQVLEDNEYLTAEFTFDCAATTVLTVRALELEVA